MAGDENALWQSPDPAEPLKVEIYTQRFGAASIRAKGLLDQKGVSYSEYIIDDDPVNKGLMIKRAFGRSDVPQIIVDNRPLGGWEELKNLEDSGELERVLGLAAPDPDA